VSLHRLEVSQFLPIHLVSAWEFFSDPRNLAALTPPDMRFEITSPLPANAYAGLVISYRVRPFASIPLTWVTEITHLRERSLFVDEQRLGPYRFWHHQHHFSEVPGGVEMRDIVHYALPLGPLGGLVNALLVRRRLQAIFGFRRSPERAVRLKRLGSLSRHAGSNDGAGLLVTLAGAGQGS